MKRNQPVIRSMPGQATLRVLLLFVVGSLFVAGAAQAQVTSNGGESRSLFVAEAAQAPATSNGRDSRFWIGSGLGVAALTIADEQGIFGVAAGNLNATYQYGRTLVSARVTLATLPFGPIYSDVGLLYGRVLSQGSFFASVGAGVAFVEGNYVGVGDNEDLFSTIGLPLEVQLFARPFRFIGVGIYGFANVNPEQSFLGATFSVQIGNFW